MSEKMLVEAIEKLSYDEMMGFAAELAERLRVDDRPRLDPIITLDEIANAVRSYAEEARADGVCQ